MHMSSKELESITPRVQVLIHNPIIESEGGRKLSEVLSWNDPDRLAAQYIEDIREASHGYVNYRVVDRVEIDGYPIKKDGFRYTDQTFLRAWRSRSGFHMPDAADYPTLLRECDFIRKLEADLVDELWMFAFPYGGYFESCMGGRGAIWCNGDVIPGTQHVSRRFVVMGFNFERGVGEMLEDMGHRAENIMEHVWSDVEENRARKPDAGNQKSARRSITERLFGFANRPPKIENRESSVVDLSGNLWRQFIRYDATHPGAAACGNVHFAPSSLNDYDWGNRRSVKSNADDWLNYPNFTGEMRMMNCGDWGNGDIRQHHIWWMKRFPHVEGMTPTGKLNNWWKYVIGLEF
jgi:hypothetical protein